MAQKRISPAFGAEVSRILTEHGLSLRAARIRTGIDHVTLSDMAAGYVPRFEKVRQFAQAFRLNLNTCLTLAGYDPIRPEEIGVTTTPSPEQIARICYRLAEKRQQPVTRERDWEGASEPRAYGGRVFAEDVDEVRRIIAEVEAEPHDREVEPES